ncbi:hypothetical protein Glove_41g80 [Diversispora epigaea]|uniref:Uncharacterized protein n=1 Tax=Diversispora epigaea TaxID=1348612 RepID=A0A397JRC3_9GLOM|nr:hypothetical protein Glove_41g80 [Diversispora epigaea]
MTATSSSPTVFVTVTTTSSAYTPPSTITYLSSTSTTLTTSITPTTIIYTQSKSPIEKVELKDKLTQADKEIVKLKPALVFTTLVRLVNYENILDLDINHSNKDDSSNHTSNVPNVPNVRQQLLHIYRN